MTLTDQTHRRAGFRVPHQLIILRRWGRQLFGEFFAGGHIPDRHRLLTTQIQLQLGQGTPYAVLAGDGNGPFSGGSAEIQIVGASNRTACLNTVAKNATGQEFSFSVSGKASQCQDGFDIAYTGVNADPYNFTVVPLDQSIFPFDVPVSNGFLDWTVNMTTGTRFTIMMK